MDKLVLAGSVILLLVLAFWLAKLVQRRHSGRKPNHPVYQESRTKQPRHRPAAHTLVHSHSTQRMHTSEDMWRASRAKSGESRWEPGVIVANKILTDSELALEERDRSDGHGIHTVDYKPTDSPRESAKQTRGGTGDRRG